MIFKLSKPYFSDNILKMELNYIIIQAGGMGTRLGHLTRNKPKGIVPVNNLPMIFHLFEKYKDKNFIIICDYLHEVLEKYLKVFAPVKYQCVVAKTKGTCAGMKEAIDLIPEDEPFMISWSDLIFDHQFDISVVKGNAIGTPIDFECRWSFVDNEFVEQRSVEHGVAGVFFFENKKVIEDVPLEGEFVRYLSTKKDVKFQDVKLIGVKEVGTLLAFSNEQKENVCRPFNKIEIKGDKLYKYGINEQGKKIAIDETRWYQYALKHLDNKYLPKIYSLDPLCLEYINGKNAFKIELNNKQKEKVMINCLNGLKYLHKVEQVSSDKSSIYKCYYEKTWDRLDKVQGLIPFADQKEITINDKTYFNPYFIKDKVKDIINNHFMNEEHFYFIHGDPTLSNIIVKDDLSIVFIDPRGYFGNTKLYGDRYYDFAKLYYSLFGNYDQFNNKNFVLDVNSDNVTLSISSSGYEFLEDKFFYELKDIEPRKIKFLHALIYLSLTTYAWEDYDSICGAFYKGTMLLNEAIKEF